MQKGTRQEEIQVAQSKVAQAEQAMADAQKNLSNIETKVPEADIAKLQTGQTARVTLDGYGDDVEWQAKVISIGPSETIIDGVATYKEIEVKTGLRGSDGNVEIVEGLAEGARVVVYENNY